MWFHPIIARWGAGALAEDLGLPKKNVQRWIDLDSIPADWFAPVARAASQRGFRDITTDMLSARAEARRLSRVKAGDGNQAAA